ncbi:Asp-tRNA(Asn)/Glu-tRNA(Gln) amidotransferase GatCAB subunit A [Kyrpidia spormannii]|uniref:Asp-tRNA(Asn)/Glu-tRNA(Gln) amidotransferase GatCAB subunit A n=1 Tax=Kyrpidia spormannii TaxID=2055160 RepID=A0A2K8N966_9BACL|nr:Asp-tRNA(Asn)/Glu-tRNA(Gln) amidotransferase GatCAB subunit A [Kyrpidia spormannii]
MLSPGRRWPKGGSRVTNEELLSLDIDGLATLIRLRELSPVEVTETVLGRIAELDPVLNVFIAVTAESALAAARRLEAELRSGKYRGPLHGVPIALKDIFTVKGEVITAGSKILAEWRADEDATVVKRLKEAGAVLVGRTNLHEFAMGATTENPHYGPTRNPWDPRRIPGGSSGGSAAAVAAGMGYGALGTDTGGSIRLPAALCGIVGLKPTYGRVSRKGLLPLSWSLDHVGPMTRTVKDAAYLLEVLAGADDGDPSCSRRPVEPYGALVEPMGDRPLKGVRLGVVREYFFEDLDDEIRRAVDRALAVSEDLGAEIVEVTVPWIDEAAVAQRAISQVEGFAVHERWFRSQPELYGEDVRIRLEIGEKIPGYQYVQAQRIRRMFQKAFLKVFDRCDAVVAPTNARPPCGIGEVGPEETVNNIFRLGRTPLFNLLGFPVLSVPCGKTSEGLPVGLQWVGRPFGEASLLGFAHAYEQATPWHREFAPRAVTPECLYDSLGDR